MGNLSNVKKSDILPEFQTFLLDKKMVPEKNVILAHYRGFKPNNLSAVKLTDLAPELPKEAKRLIRLKHYSYSMERTCLR
ncbi:MAG: hypothetical protein HY742_09185 [Deltaproteobacteria bacterium]|nr:hypothetical protein [Deltaproteobacteria bacterium]